MTSLRVFSSDSNLSCITVVFKSVDKRFYFSLLLSANYLMASSMFPPSFSVSRISSSFSVSSVVYV